MSVFGWPRTFRASIQESPDVEFKSGSRDYDVQQHKVEVYQAFERRLKSAFPEGIKIDRFEFGLDFDSNR